MERYGSRTRRGVVGSLVLIGLLALGSVSFGQTTADLESARRIDLPFSGDFDISSDEDVDYFRFQLPASRYGVEIVIDIDADSRGSTLDSLMSLYDESGNEIAYDDDTDGRDPFISGPLVEGVYYIEVRGYSASAGAYTITVESSPIEAESIRLPYVGTFEISKGGERDIFVFDAEGGAYGQTVVIDIDAESIESGLDSIIYLYDERWQGIDYDDDTDGYDPYLRARVAQRTYYIVVEAYDEVTGPYTLKVDTEFIEPTSIELPVSVQSEIAAAYEGDLYRIELRKDATIVIDIDAEAAGSSLDSYLYLYDDEWIEVTRDDDSDGSDSYIEATLAAGIYFIEVKGYSDSTGDYTLTVETVNE